MPVLFPFAQCAGTHGLGRWARAQDPRHGQPVAHETRERVRRGSGSPWEARGDGVPGQRSGPGAAQAQEGGPAGLDVDIDISWDDRSRACEALWAFQFKGEAHKEVAVELGAVELLVDFLARPPEPGTVPAKDRFAVNAMAHHSLVCLRSLASHEPNVQHMVYAGVPEQMVKEVKSASEDHKVLALECLCCLAKHDKSTRVFLTGPKSRLLVKILGDKKAGQQNFHRLVKSGVETVAMAALHMVEVLLTRDEHRLFVLNETFVISVMRSVMDSRNQGAQAMVCRVVMRL